jgi:hypothetical protein
MSMAGANRQKRNENRGSYPADPQNKAVGSPKKNACAPEKPLRKSAVRPATGKKIRHFLGISGDIARMQAHKDLRPALR